MAKLSILIISIQLYWKNIYITVLIIILSLPKLICYSFILIIFALFNRVIII